MKAVKINAKTQWSQCDSLSVPYNCSVQSHSGATGRLGSRLPTTFKQENCLPHPSVLLTPSARSLTMNTPNRLHKYIITYITCWTLNSRCGWLGIYCKWFEKRRSYGMAQHSSGAVAQFERDSAHRGLSVLLSISSLKCGNEKTAIVVDFQLARTEWKISSISFSSNLWYIWQFHLFVCCIVLFFPPHDRWGSDSSDRMSSLSY